MKGAFYSKKVCQSEEFGAKCTYRRRGHQQLECPLAKAMIMDTWERPRSNDNNIEVLDSRYELDVKSYSTARNIDKKPLKQTYNSAKIFY